MKKMYNLLIFFVLIKNSELKCIKNISTIRTPLMDAIFKADFEQIKTLVHQDGNDINQLYFSPKVDDLVTALDCAYNCLDWCANIIKILNFRNAQTAKQVVNSANNLLISSMMNLDRQIVEQLIFDPTTNINVLNGNSQQDLYTILDIALKMQLKFQEIIKYLEENNADLRYFITHKPASLE